MHQINELFTTTETIKNFPFHQRWLTVIINFGCLIKNKKFFVSNLIIILWRKLSSTTYLEKFTKFFFLNLIANLASDLNLT